MKQALILSIIAILVCATTEVFAVVGHPTLQKEELSKKERRQLKRQQKLFKWAEKIQHNKVGEFINSRLWRSDSIACDTIFLRNGREITANIFELNDNNIEYVRCENLNGPRITLSSQALREIRYHDGQIKVINKATVVSSSPTERPQYSDNIKDTKTKNASTVGAVVGTICGLFSLLGLIGILILYLVYEGSDPFIRKTVMRQAWSSWAIATLVTILFVLLVGT